MNLKTVLIASALLPLAMACNNDTKVASKETDSTTTVTKGHDQEHRFACPMHPDVTGKEGDTCPKCGMKLEHADQAPTAAGTYFMQFVTAPTTVEPNKEVTLSLAPKKKDAANEQVALDVKHEKKIHLIVVSDDLSWFDHIHPEFGSDGAYTVKTKFPAPGKYKAFADYQPTGGSAVVDKIDIDVAGNAPAAKTFSGQKLTGTSDNYSFELIPTGGKLETGTPLHIEGIVKKDGKEINASSLDNYLGAKAHFVLISLNEKEYLHVHPEVEAGKFDLHTTIEKPGIYRGWVQFNADGKIHTIDFTWNVTKGSGTATPGADDHSGHSH